LEEGRKAGAETTKDTKATPQGFTSTTNYADVLKDFSSFEQ